MQLTKKHFLFGGIVLIVLAIVIAIVANNRSHNAGNNDEYFVDYDGNYYDNAETFVDRNNSGDDEPGDNSFVGNSIIITGITGISGFSNITVYDDTGLMIAEASTSFRGDSAEYSLWESYRMNRFTGTGSYIISLSFESDGWEYYYTNGETLENLGVLNKDDILKLPKFTIYSTESTIPFSQFKPLYYLGIGGK
jgi:hypothetical protein